MSSQHLPRFDPEAMNQFIFEMLEEIHIAVGEKPERVLSLFMDALTQEKKNEVLLFLAEESLRTPTDKSGVIWHRARASYFSRARASSVHGYPRFCP